MKILQGYLDRAVQLENLAANEPNPEFKAGLFRQAFAYRQMAADRAKLYSLPAPSPRDLSIILRPGRTPLTCISRNVDSL